MPGYNHKDEVQLAYDANKKRLRAEGQIILARLMNEALAEMTHQFNEGLSRGEILNIAGSANEMKALLRVAATRELGAGDADEG